MLSPVTQQWLALLSLYGWIWIIPLIENLNPLTKQKAIRRGIINDLVHTYHPIHLHTYLNAAFSAWLAVYVREHGSNAMPLQGSLVDAHWTVNFISILLMGHVTFYVTHFCSHKIPFLWQFHRVHHSSTTLDSFSTSRFHIVDKALFAAPYLVMVSYFQPDPALVFLFISFQDFWARYGHGNIKDPHWLGYFMSNPKFHRWHHSNHPEAIDKNFSAEFNFLDYLFGTAYYPKDRLPDNFGEDGYSNNIVVQHVKPLVDIVEIARKKGIKSLFKNNVVAAVEETHFEEDAA